jgi:hypothetical protein
VKHIPPGAKGKPHPGLKGEPGTRPVTDLSERRKQARKPPPSEPQSQAKPVAAEAASPIAIGQSHGGEVPKAPHIRAVASPSDAPVAMKQQPKGPKPGSVPHAPSAAHTAPTPATPAAKAPAVSAPAAIPQPQGATPKGPSAKRKKAGTSASATSKGYKSHDPGDPEIIRGRSVTGPGPKVDKRTAGKLAKDTEAGQTYARTEQPIAPGVTRRSTTAARQSEATRPVREVSVADIQQHVAAMNKGGVKFKFSSKRLAAHAEVKQIIKRPNQHVSVTQRPCPSCMKFFSAEARFQGKRQTIADPDRTWVFEPDGSVWTKQH